MILLWPDIPVTFLNCTGTMNLTIVLQCFTVYHSVVVKPAWDGLPYAHSIISKP